MRWVRLSYADLDKMIRLGEMGGVVKPTRGVMLLQSESESKQDGFF